MHKRESAAAGCCPPRLRACPDFSWMYGVYCRIIGKSRLYIRQYCQAVTSERYIKIVRLLMKINKTLESDAINHSNELRHPAHDDEQ